MATEFPKVHALHSEKRSVSVTDEMLRMSIQQVVSGVVVVVAMTLMEAVEQEHTDETLTKQCLSELAFLYFEPLCESVAFQQYGMRYGLHFPVTDVLFPQ